MEVAQKREAAKKAQKLATPPKPYTVKKLSTQVWVPMIGNEDKTYVKFPSQNSVYTRITGSLEALGIKAANANPGTRTSVVGRFSRQPQERFASPCIAASVTALNRQTCRILLTLP